MKTKLIFVDIDGTLTPAGTNTPPESAVDAIKKEQKKGDMTEDDLKDLEKDLQKLTDDYIKEVDKLIAAKEKELFEI